MCQRGFGRQFVNQSSFTEEQQSNPSELSFQKFGLFYCLTVSRSRDILHFIFIFPFFFGGLNITNASRFAKLGI